MKTDQAFKFAALSPRCPIGFTFTWNGDCPGQPLQTWRYVRREGVLPLFTCDDCEPRWSSRLETVAQAAYMARLAERGSRATLRDIVREHISCGCSDTQARVSDLLTALELREVDVRLCAAKEAIDDLQRRMLADVERVA